MWKVHVQLLGGSCVHAAETRLVNSRWWIGRRCAALSVRVSHFVAAKLASRVPQDSIVHM